MLVLTVKINGEIKISDEITVKLLEINGNQASLGIKAPKHISVLREELYSRMNSNFKKEKKEQEEQEEVSKSKKREK